MDLKEIINTRPDKSDFGGSAAWKLTHLHDICVKIKPNLIIESGTWRGNSLWLLRNLNINAELHSYDINYTNLKWRDKSINYHEYDINLDSGKYSPNDNDLIFFDDHQNQEDRLSWAKDNGFKHIIFDDNIPSVDLPKFKMPPIPTLEMLREDNKLPDYIVEYRMLEYDNSDPNSRNNGQTYLTYVKIE